MQQYEPREEEARKQHLLLMVDSALRAGRTDTEISELVDEAVDSDAALEQHAA
jgi:hypothetical protein